MISPDDARVRALSRIQQQYVRLVPMHQRKEYLVYRILTDSEGMALGWWKLR